MVEIARHSENGGIFQKDIAENQGISIKYLDQIISGLKVAKLIRKIKARGGYVLINDPSEITMYDINNAFEPSICIIECLENGIVCDREKKCETKGFWSKLNKLITDHYKSVTLEDIIQKRESLDDDKVLN